MDEKVCPHCGTDQEIFNDLAQLRAILTPFAGNHGGGMIGSPREVVRTAIHLLQSIRTAMKFLRG